jgi:CSLREA domain-containing protein
VRLRRPLHPLVVLACLILALCPALEAPHAVAAAALSFTVTTTADAPDASPGDGLCATSAQQCTLRAAVQEANAQAAGSTVAIAVPAGNYALALGALTVLSNTVVISGVGSATTQLVGQGDRVLVVARGARAVVAGVTLTNGNAGASVGGGVVNLGLLVMSQSAISKNHAQNGGGLYSGPSAWLALVGSSLNGNVVTTSGGGLLNDGGRVTLYNTTVLSNTGKAGNGGGIENGGTLTVSNSTLRGNTLSGNTSQGDLGGGIYSTGPLTVSDSTISGNSSTTSGGGIFNSGTVTIINSILSSNSARAGGGGIFNDFATVTVSNTTLSGNTVTADTSGFGGGIFNYGMLTVSDSTLSGNSALAVSNSAGGGIHNQGTLTVSDSTLSGNSATGGGGGINTYGGLTVIVSDSTLSGNSASSGSGIDNTNGYPLKVTGTIVADNTGSPNCSGQFSDLQGYNLDSGTSCGFTQTTDLTGTNPLLGPLANNGGPTQTMALLPGSPAIDHGGTAANGCPATDQRGVTRPQGPACDIGAYEYAP